MVVITKIPNCPLSPEQMRSIVSAVIAKSLHDNLKVPGRVNITLVNDKIVRDSKECWATIDVNLNRPQEHGITLSCLGRQPGEIAYSLYHEVKHLVRAWNGLAKIDNELEEIENKKEIDGDMSVVELIAAALNSTPNKEYVEDEGVSQLVCIGDTRSPDGLQVRQSSS